MIKLIGLFFALTLFAQSGSVVAQDPVRVLPASQTEDTNAADRYRIGYQDAIEVQVFGQPQLSQRVRVNSNGTVNLFRLPEPLVAVCKTERELANDIADAYRKDYLRNPEVNVTTVEQLSQSFAVIGAVEKPANYFISKRPRLLELLAYAGGPSKDAGSTIMVARKGSSSNCQTVATPDENSEITVLSFKLRDVLENKADILMAPGDVVSVMKSDVVFVYGNVIKQGPVTMAEPITLLQAIASAEGLKPASAKDSVRIFRQKPGSLDREEFVYSLNDINKQKARDPFLEPNDIVAISEDKAKSIFNAIGKSLTQGVGTIFYRVTP